MVGRRSSFAIHLRSRGEVRLPGKAIHVVMQDGHWAVVHAGDRRPLAVHDRRREAVTEARALAARDGVELVVFDVGGRPLPPDAPDVTP